jgi:quercetin dioxygenase-like cupin family protein
MIKRVARHEAQVYPLPGRDWILYIGPQNSPARNVSVGLAIFPPGSRPAGHVHLGEEETIFVTAGRGAYERKSDG